MVSQLCVGTAGEHHPSPGSVQNSRTFRNGWGTGGIVERRSTVISEEVPLFPAEQIYDE